MAHGDQSYGLVLKLTMQILRAMNTDARRRALEQLLSTKPNQEMFAAIMDNHS